MESLSTNGTHTHTHTHTHTTTQSQSAGHLVVANSDGVDLGGTPEGRPKKLWDAQGKRWVTLKPPEMEPPQQLHASKTFASGNK